MKIGFKQAPEFIGITGAEEADFFDAAVAWRIDRFQRFHINREIGAIGKGSDKFPVMKQMDRLWLVMDIFRIPRFLRIGRKDFNDENGCIHDRQNDQRNISQPMTFKPPPDQLPL